MICLTRDGEGLIYEARENLCWWKLFRVFFFSGRLSSMAIIENRNRLLKIRASNGAGSTCSIVRSFSGGREIFLFGKSIFARGGLLASSAHEQAESLGVLWESRSAEKIKSWNSTPSAQLVSWVCVCVHNFKCDGVPLCLSTHIGLMMVAARDRQFYCIRYTVKSFFSLFLYKINIWTASPCTGLRDGGDHVTTTTTRAVRSGELFGEHMRLISMPFFASSGGSSSSSVGFWKTFSGAARSRKTYSARVKQGDRVWERVWARTSDPDGWKADENDEENYTFYSASLSAGPEQSSSGWPRRVRRRFFFLLFFCCSERARRRRRSIKFYILHRNRLSHSVSEGSEKRKQREKSSQHRSSASEISAQIGHGTFSVVYTFFRL